MTETDGLPSTSGNGTLAGTDGNDTLPDWTELYRAAGGNATESQIRAQYLAEYHKQHENDPEVKYAVLIFYAIMLVMVGAQSALFWWKQKHKRSYELVTLLGLWLVPAVICLYFGFWRFIAVWALYTCATGYMISLCTAKKLAATTPRLVYSWFLNTYNVSVFMGVAGYALLLMDILAAGQLSKSSSDAPMWLTLLWYGVYFGVLGRDCAEVAADRMVAKLGTGRRMAVSVRDCGICGGELHDYAGLGEGQPNKEKSVQLACKHLFHDLCIRGWTLVGKKDTCPCCLEKVDLRSVFADRPWETRNLNWIQMLDAVRYMVVWNPLILIGFHFVLHWMGVDKHAKDRRLLEQHLTDLHGNMTAIESGNLTLGQLGLLQLARQPATQ